MKITSLVLLLIMSAFASIGISAELPSVQSLIEEIDIPCATLNQDITQLMPSQQNVDIVIFYPVVEKDYYYVIGFSERNQLQLGWWGATLSEARRQCDEKAN